MSNLDAQQVRIAIVGAGMTGLTAALTLAASGVQGVAVFEAAHALEEVGAGIAIGGNAVRVLQALGVNPARFGHTPPALEFRSWDNAKILSSTSIGPGYTHDMGAPYLTFHRSTLQQAFVQRARTLGVDLTADRRLVAVDPGSDERRARLEFAHGAPVEADIVIAADGIRSATRACIVPAAWPRYSGEIAFRGVVPAERVPAYPSPENLSIWCGPRTHAVNYAVDDGRLVNLFAVFRPASLPPWTANSNRQRGERAEAVSNFAGRGWHQSIVDLIAAAEGDLHYWALTSIHRVATGRGTPDASSDDGAEAAVGLRFERFPGRTGLWLLVVISFVSVWVIVCGHARPPAPAQVGAKATARRSASAWLKRRAQGQRSGMRRVGRPERLTRRPGTAK